MRESDLVRESFLAPRIAGIPSRATYTLRCAAPAGRDSCGSRHQLANRVAAHAFVCVLAYALWKGLDHLVGRPGLMTRIRKPDEQGSTPCPQDRRMSPAAALRILHDVQIGDILLRTTDGRTLRLRRVARPTPEQADLLAGLRFTLPERICADQDVTPPAGSHPTAV